MERVIVLGMRSRGWGGDVGDGSVVGRSGVFGGYASLAQSVERQTLNLLVAGSSPAGGG